MAEERGTKWGQPAKDGTISGLGEEPEEDEQNGNGANHKQNDKETTSEEA